MAYYSAGVCVTLILSVGDVKGVRKSGRLRRVVAFIKLVSFG